MTSLLFGIYGASGHGRDIMPVARQKLKADERLVFIDDDPMLPTEVNGHMVMSYEAFLGTPAHERYAVISIADSQVRGRLYERLKADRIGSFSVVAANAVIMDDVEIGEGALLSPFVTLTSNIRIGRGFHANLYSYVAHDCRIGDFVTFGPAVKCNGNVVIEDMAYIGAGAVIKQGRPGAPTTIGRGAVVGMGAVVTHSVPAGMVVVGNPAKQLRTS